MKSKKITSKSFIKLNQSFKDLRQALKEANRSLNKLHLALSDSMKNFIEMNKELDPNFDEEKFIKDCESFIDLD
jgi:hypothetical protein